MKIRLDPTESVATRPLFMLATPGNNKFFYTFDGNKNVSELVHFESRNGIAAHYDYAPFGAVTRAVNNSAISARNFHLENPFRFSSEYHDDTLGLVYYTYRFYIPSYGYWLNRDLIGERGGKNLYAFCLNNPVLYYDLNGEWVIVDNVIAAIGGAVLGGSCQAIADMIRGEVSGWESYVGSAISGAIMGEVLLHNPAMAGVLKAAYSGMAASVGNGIKQFCEVYVSKKTERFNTQEMTINFAAGATIAMIPFPGIKGINKGRGSCLSIARSMNTKFKNGTISQVSKKTTLKSFIGTSFEYGMIYGIAQPYVTDQVDQGVDSFLDLINSVECNMSFLYKEELFININDECDNSIMIYGVREGVLNE